MKKDTQNARNFAGVDPFVCLCKQKCNLNLTVSQYPGTPCYNPIFLLFTTVVYVVVIPCLPGVYTIYTRYCVNKPEGVARGFINTIPSVNGIHTMVCME